MADPVVDAHPTSLDPSALGTQEYWEQVYRTDLRTHAHTPAHIGQVWFDESGAEERTLAFLAGRDDLDLDPATARVLDVGTGNGSMLLRLREDGWDGELWGVDYSPASVRFARRIIGAGGAQQRTNQDRDDEGDAHEAPTGTTTADHPTSVDDASEPAPGIHIVQHDVLRPWPPPMTDASASRPPTQFDLVHDKGTFDAISLAPDASDACRVYQRRVAALLRPGGVLLITSCNWTEAELEHWMGGRESLLQRVGRVRYSTFTFGGQQGSQLAGLCWRRTEATQ